MDEHHPEHRKYKEGKRAREQGNKRAEEKGNRGEKNVSPPPTRSPAHPLSLLPCFPMAKVTPSALISEITGRIDGHVFSMWKGQIVLKSFTNPTQPKSEAQQKIRGFYSNLSGKYYALSAINKTEWQIYADALPEVMSGYNAFIRNNTRLLYANHPLLVEITTPPDPPAPPDAPVGFTASYDSGDDEFDLTWTTPIEPSLFIQAFFSPKVGYHNDISPHWAFLVSQRSHEGPIHMDASGYSSPRTIRFRLRVIDPCGEISAYTTIEEASK